MCVKILLPRFNLKSFSSEEASISQHSNGIGRLNTTRSLIKVVFEVFNLP